MFRLSRVFWTIVPMSRNNDVQRSLVWASFAPPLRLAWAEPFAAHILVCWGHIWLPSRWHSSWGMLFGITQSKSCDGRRSMMWQRAQVHLLAIHLVLIDVLISFLVTFDGLVWHTEPVFWSPEAALLCSRSIDQLYEGCEIVAFHPVWGASFS